MRRTETSTLAFLDVMACGLGAVILILVVLKQQAPVESLVTQPQPTIAMAALENDLEVQQAELADMLAARDIKQSALDVQSRLVADIRQQIAQKVAALADAKSRDVQLKKALAKANATITELSENVPTDTVQTPVNTQPQYLVGVTVTGKKIAILLDRSASMSARELLQILQFKARPGSQRRSAEKWINATNAVWWLGARAPRTASLQIASFSTATKFHTKGWVQATDSAKLTVAQTEMAKLFPDGGTNLEAAVTGALAIGADSIYIITDGLPTKASSGETLLGLDGCGSKLSSAQQVTGKCRISLFQRIVKLTAGSAVRISVILMPLEGDPDAAPLFSKWVLSKNGTLLSVARNWP